MTIDDEQDSLGGLESTKIDNDDKQGKSFDGDHSWQVSCIKKSVILSCI